MGCFLLLTPPPMMQSLIYIFPVKEKCLTWAGFAQGFGILYATGFIHFTFLILATSRDLSPFWVISVALLFPEYVKPLQSSNLRVNLIRFVAEV